MRGRCARRAASHRLTQAPFIVHYRHCRWCRRRTGSAFVVDARVETGAFVREGGMEEILTPTASARGRRIPRRRRCKVALWRHYSGGGPTVAFARTGTLENPDACPPDAHILTMSKQPSVAPPAGARAFREFHDPAEVRTPEAKARWAATRLA